MLFSGPALHAQGLESNISVHDPVITKEGDTYYIFATGAGIQVWSSKDMKLWKHEPPVFSATPEWAVKAVPEFKNFIWAPDIYHDNGQYYLYYSISAFGKNTSAIGVATNKTLDAASSDFKWTDHGMVIQSVPGKTDFNAIDPNVIKDENNTPWMVFGSFWGGIKQVKLGNDLLHVADGLNEIKTIASRIVQKEPADAIHAGPNAIEAPFIFKKEKYYYLFASIDYCCRGKNSTYKMIVGRSKKVTGPYLDAEGKPLAKGGGTILLEGDSDWYGVGHNAVSDFDGTSYLVFHGYAAKENGKPKLRIEKLKWIKGWPVVQSN
nr:arabinan endo-1,5-alpha-L-arabinosidase [Pedobacter panaciterrae]